MMSSRGGSADSITGLIALLGDPKASAAKLAELKEQQDAITDKMAELHAQEAALAPRSAELDKRAEQLKAETRTLDERQAALEKREAAADKRAATLAAKMDAIKAERAENERIAGLWAEEIKAKQARADGDAARNQATMNDLAKQQEALAAREAKLAEAEAAVEVLADEYRAKLAQLKSIVG